MGTEEKSGDGTQVPTSEQKTEPEITNRDVKNHPVFLKLAEENARLKAAEEKRKTDEAAAATDAERRKLESKQRYDEALAAQKADFESRMAELERKNLEQQLTNELLKVGFKNSVFNNGAIKGFDPEKSTIQDYVKALVEDESNKIFLDNAAKQLIPKGDVPTPTGLVKSMTPDELKASLKSDDPKIRSAARELAKKNWLKAGSTGIEQ